MSDYTKVGFGSFFYPTAITVGDISMALGKPLERQTRRIALQNTLNDGKEVFVTDDGFVCLMVKQAEDALTELNTIFATGIAWGIMNEKIIAKDLCACSWKNGTDTIMITEYYIPSERIMFSLQRDEEGEKLNEWKKYPRELVTLDTCRGILHMAHWFTTNPNLHNDLMLLFEGYSLYYKDAFVGAFLYGWMIVETFLARLWDDYVDSLGRKNNDKKALKDFRSWTSYHYIEMFSILGIMAAETRDLLNNLRRKRNQVVHDRIEVNKREAYDCLNVARKIIRNLTKTPDKPFLEVTNADINSN